MAPKLAEYSGPFDAEACKGLIKEVQKETGAKGKQREGTLTDADLALQLYVEDLKRTEAALSDRKIAQSIATAVIRDGPIIDSAYRKEEQIARVKSILTQDQIPAYENLVAEREQRARQAEARDAEVERQRTARQGTN